MRRLYQDRDRNYITRYEWQARIKDVSTHILIRTVQMDMISLANGILISPRQAMDELKRRMGKAGS